MSANGFIGHGIIRSNGGNGHYGGPRLQGVTFPGDPVDAPLNKPLRCQAPDGDGLRYILPMFCIRTESGWINAKTKTPLHVPIIGWKYP